MSPDPIRRKGRKTLAKVYDSLTDPEEAADRSRIIGLPTKKEAHDIRNELTAAAWAGGKTVSRTQTAKEYISIVESFFRKLRAIKNTEPRTPQTGIPTLRELPRDTRVTNLDECERMIETARADTAILLVGRERPPRQRSPDAAGLERDATENGEGDDPPGPRNGKRPQSRPARIQAQVLPAIGKGVRRRSGGSPSPRSRTRPAGRRSLFRLTLESFLSPSRTHGPDSARFSPIQLVPHSFSAAP
ncbi:MAG: hypothetical protein ACLRL4_04200 [Bifidobacterium bifidum]